jgi:hypothetical protein
MKLLRTLRDMLREVFDESAYERFCKREGVASSRESYARFLRQASAATVKVKCC